MGSILGLYFKLGSILGPNILDFNKTSRRKFVARGWPPLACAASQSSGQRPKLHKSRQKKKAAAVLFAHLQAGLSLRRWGALRLRLQGKS